MCHLLFGRPELGTLSIDPLEAVGAHAVAELGLGMMVDEDLELVPVAFVVADLLAAGADQQKPFEHLDLRHLLRHQVLQPRWICRRSRWGRTRASSRSLEIGLVR